MRLTVAEKSALLQIVDERLAGGTSDLRDALGLTNEEAAKLEGLLESAAKKLAHV